MNRPFFSIIIPCYNQAHFLDECVSSISEQGFMDWEMIIVNDGSTDNTLEKAEVYCKKNSRIKLINKTNGGLSSARNAGLEMANGEFLQFLDSDDYLLPDCLSKLHELIHNNQTEFDLAQCGYVYVAEYSGKVIHKVLPSNKQSLLPGLLHNNLGPCHSIFIRAEIAKNLGGFDEQLKSVEDWDYWMRAAKAGARLIPIQEPLVAYRYVSNSMSRNADTMYEALKIVTFRANLKDNRITYNSPENIERDLDLKATLKRHILLCAGLSVTQGKVDKAVKLFLAERDKYELEFTTVDFALMCSYLNFRYWNSKTELQAVITEYIPRFKSFFNPIGLTQNEKKKALAAVFEGTYKKWNHVRYGKFFGSLINKL